MSKNETKARQAINGQIKISLKEKKRLQTAMIEEGMMTLSWMLGSI